MTTVNSLSLTTLVLACGFRVSEQIIQADEKQQTAPKISVNDERLEGTWKLLQCKSDGADLPVPKEGMELIVKDGLLNVKLGERLIMRGTYSADPSAKPKTIDILNSAGEFRGKKTLAIYEFKGGELWMALATAGETMRPVDFSCKKLSGHVLSIYKK